MNKILVLIIVPCVVAFVLVQAQYYGFNGYSPSGYGGYGSGYGGGYGGGYNPWLNYYYARQYYNGRRSNLLGFGNLAGIAALLFLVAYAFNYTGDVL